MPRSYKLTFKKSRKMSLLPSTGIRGRNSWVQEIPQWQTLKIFYPFQRSASSKKKIKSFLSFITSEVFLICSRLKGFQGDCLHELMVSPLGRSWFSTLTMPQLSTNCYADWSPIKYYRWIWHQRVHFVIHQDFVAFCSPRLLRSGSNKARLASYPWHWLESNAHQMAPLLRKLISSVTVPPWSLIDKEASMLKP